MTKEIDEPPHRREPIKIREMEIDDLAQVFHIGETLFRAEATPNMYRTWDDYEVVGLFHSDREFCLVAEDGGRIAGFALGTIITKSHSAWKYGYLIWLGVAHPYQRRGLAERLVQRFKHLMLKNGVRMLMIDTPADNLPSLRFFRKQGFGQPREHIYLTLNLAADRQRYKARAEGQRPDTP